jgi:hypothetical protein
MAVDDAAGRTTSRPDPAAGGERSVPAAGGKPERAAGGEYDISLAGPEDEEDLRRLVGSVAMPGAVSMRFEREPDYFLGTTIAGDRCDVLIARRRSDGALMAMLNRAERRVFINGLEMRIGYVGQVRAAPGANGRWLLGRGIPLFRRLDDPPLRYLGVIAADNPRARRLLVERRPPGGIHATRITGLTGFALLLRRRRRSIAQGLTVTGATPEALPEVVSFLRRVGSGRQLFPAYREQDFLDGRTMRDLRLEDLGVARRAGRIVGVLGMWDQSGYKQEIVAGYSPGLRRVKPVMDLAARLVGARPLPRVGERILVGVAEPVCIENDDPLVFRALLERAMACALDRGLALLMIGFPDDDPLLREARRTLHVTYRSDVFLASLREPSPAAGLDGRLVYCNLATLWGRTTWRREPGAGRSRSGRRRS